MAKKLLLILIMSLSACLLSCAGNVTTTVTTEPEIEPCEWEFTETVNEQIPIKAIYADKATLSGNIANFINICKPEKEGGIVFESSLIRSHQLIVELDKIYPINHVLWLQMEADGITDIGSVSVDLSLDGESYSRVLENWELGKTKTLIDIDDQLARYIRFSFPYVEGERNGIRDLRVILGSGFIISEADEWTDSFKRFETWTGADGIFSFNLAGSDSIGEEKSHTAFVFSDTFTGNVNPETSIRMSNHLINNSLGYYDGTLPIASGMRFAYAIRDGVPESAFLPTAYLGYNPGNVYSTDGLSEYLSSDGLLTNAANGTMWQTPVNAENWLLADLHDKYAIKDLYLWNHNGNQDYGIRSFKVLTSDDKLSWQESGIYELPRASGNPDEPYSLKISINKEARYVKLEIISGYDPGILGLGKMLFTTSDDKPLFASIEASDFDREIAGNETSARLWLQDGIVLDGYFYCFPLLVKDYSTYFKVHQVGLIKAQITNDEIEFASSEYSQTPLMSLSEDTGSIYFGAGVMDNVDVDGYIYIYGYKDLDGRYLVVARVHPEAFTDFNQWRYYDGSSWVENINDVAPLKEGVSAELSVTHLPTGMFADKYMLVVMEDTTSGRVGYALSDTPFGPFTDYVTLYKTPENGMYTKAFTYNAKMHAHLSEPGKYLISYNVNTTSFTALANANIYRPRFIWVCETNPDNQE